MNIRGGGTLDRVVVNEPQYVYVRMYVDGGNVIGIVIMTNNDVTQTKYIAGGFYIGFSSSLSIGDMMHIVINNVNTHMGTELVDAKMMRGVFTKITIGSASDPDARGTWTSTILPDNTRVELDCKVVDNSNSIITAKCDSETTWGKSVFNRIPIYINSGAQFGFIDTTNHILFSTKSFQTEGSIPSGWSRYNMTGHESNLTIGNQFTIMGLPESFVSHWVDTIHAKAWIGKDKYTDNYYAMFVPPE